MPKMLDRPKIDHIVRAVAAITDEKCFVIIGTGAFIASVKNVPLNMMLTRELDIYSDGADPDKLSELIDGTMGEGSPFDLAFGYYAHGVGERTAYMPSDWRSRAKLIRLSSGPEIRCLCPERNDIAISKLCAWRDKDKDWLRAGVMSGTINFDLMKARVGAIENANAPDLSTLKERLNLLQRSISTPAIDPAQRRKTRRDDEGGYGY